MTFDDKVKRRRRTALFVTLAYMAAVLTVECVLAFFVFWVAMPDLPSAARSVACALLGVSTLWAFFAGWNAQRSHKTSLDVWLRDADQVELDVIAAAINGDKDRLFDATTERARIAPIRPAGRG
jgi:hypothetical protein